jgi:hypothetical protein
MKKVLIVPLLILMACGGGISDEQRKQMREASEQQAIVKVTESEILDAAFGKGRGVLAQLKQASPDTAQIARENAVEIHWLGADAKHGLEIEHQLIEAYLNSLLTDSPLQDNVQKIGNDSLLYTTPIVLTRADSSIEIRGTWNVWMSKKQLILGMTKK